MTLLRTFATALARSLARATRSTRPRTDVTDGYEAWLAESFPGVR